jgi:hypothetical protein
MVGAFAEEPMMLYGQDGDLYDGCRNRRRLSG